MLIERVDGDADVDASGNAAAVSLSRQLKRVTSKDQALRVITDAFTLKLKKMLRIPAETDVPESLALVDQGVDSLVAVDVRSWNSTPTCLFSRFWVVTQFLISQAMPWSEFPRLFLIWTAMMTRQPMKRSQLATSSLSLQLRALAQML
ncbi:hypothetical protein LB505_009286 [Fusarium chuoi]|nr:hypothetical protein LB505_009286 [Fusarium chuoi]